MKPIESGVLKFRYDYDYLVAFKDRSKCGNWLGRIFGHCFLYRNITATTSIRIEPSLSGTLIIPYKCNVKEIMADLAVDYNIYVWTVKHEDVQKPNILMFGSCVGIVKNLLGIRKWWVITPKQLEKYIKRSK